MIEVELFLATPEIASSDRDPNDPLSGWKFLGKATLLDLPSVGDQISLARDQTVRIRAVTHLAETKSGGQMLAPVVRLMVDVLTASECVGPGR